MATKATTKEEEVKLNIELKGVKAKLQTARVALLEKGLSKTGNNDFAHFEFFQLKDFLPEAQRIFTKLGLTTNYTIMPRVIAYTEHQTGETISKEPIIREIARLVIEDIETDETKVFEMEVAPVQIGNNTKQNIYQAAGGRSTYYKRYLYRDALEIEESDESDTVLGSPEVNYQEPQLTPYDFQPVQYAQTQPVQYQQAPQQISQPVSIQQATVEQNLGASVKIDIPVNITQTTNPNDLISEASKEEVMTMILSKNLNGFDVLNSYCQTNNINSPAELKESDKVGLLSYIGTL